MWGIPALDSKQHLDKIQRLLREKDDAEAAGADERRSQLYEEINREYTEWGKFLEAHRSAEPRIPLLMKHPPEWVAPHVVIARHATRK